MPILPNVVPSGMTIGSMDLPAPTTTTAAGDRELIAHELVHVRQYAELGYLSVLCCRYLRRLRPRHPPNTASITARAYLAIPAEVQARADAGRLAGTTSGGRNGLRRPPGPSDSLSYTSTRSERSFTYGRSA